RINGLRLSAGTINLRPAGDSGLHMVSECIDGDPSLIFAVVRGCVRPWADQRHLATQHIEKLRQLVDVSPPQQAPQAGHARIIARGLPDYRPVLENGHGAKFEDPE